MDAARVPESGDGLPGQIGRLPVLDGWRAVSILSVMAAHMLPVGPREWAGNAMLARFGMGIFFALSGFLITSILWRDQHVGRFLTRRLARIVPLVWLAIAIVFTLKGASLRDWIANLLFYANLPPFHLAQAGHFWSLGVEMQFYAAIALAVAVVGRRGLWLLPIGAIVVMALRIAMHSPHSIVTWLRADDIFAGGCLALAWLGVAGPRVRHWIGVLPTWPLVLLTLIASREEFGWIEYARPWLTAAMVGSLLGHRPSSLRPILESKALGYVARISFALYVIHVFTLEGWFGTGDKLVKYLKRPLSIAISFALAHLSTFYFEAIFIRWSHRKRFEPMI